MTASKSIVPAETRLLKPLKVGKVQLKHRIVYAPLTRYRNDTDSVATPMMRKYYADRAVVPGTLVISEATGVSHIDEGEERLPGFVSDAQVEAWRSVIDGVHAHGSYWFQQIWGMGRASNPEYMRQRGFKYRSSSSVPMSPDHETPEAMTDEEIEEEIQAFVDTAKRVVGAGGDGVEIHSAHGYLLDQFLSDAINKRTDKWGGSIENRARLTLTVVRRVAEAVGVERVAIRLSPFASFQGAEKADIHELYTYIINELKKIGDGRLAYISLVEPAGDPGALLLGTEAANLDKSLDFILELWDNRSPVMVAGAYRPDTAARALEEHYQKWDVLVAFGRLFLANPDMVYRIKKGIELNPYNRSTFYLKGQSTGYNDYPFSDEFVKEHPEAIAPEL